MAAASGLKRVDEHRLNDLRDRAQRRDPTLSEMDLLWLSVLEDRYALFLEEGMRALKAAQPKQVGSPQGATASNSSFGDSTGSPRGAAAGSNTSFVGSLISRVRKRSGTVSSAAPSQQESSRLCKHWSWVAEYLVIGAVPLADPTCVDPSAHLVGLREQCKDRGRSISLVVSSLEFDESASEDLRTFATPREWETMLGTTAFVHVGLPRDLNAPIALSFEEMVASCVQIHDAMVHRGACVYVHCKAGMSRCWVVAMCYLVAHRNMTLLEASDLLSVVRPQLDPTPVQRQYVAEFETYVRSLRAPLRSREEDDATYARLLAELLSLPPEYRRRIARDLELLT